MLSQELPNRLEGQELLPRLPKIVNSNKRQQKKIVTKPLMISCPQKKYYISSYHNWGPHFWDFCDSWRVSIQIPAVRESSKNHGFAQTNIKVATKLTKSQQKNIKNPFLLDLWHRIIMKILKWSFISGSLCSMWETHLSKKTPPQKIW